VRTKTEGSTLLTYTGLCGELEHLKIKMRLIDERFTDKRDLKIKPICECGYHERLKSKSEEESTHLVYTGLFGELEHLKVKTRLIDEKFVSVMGECVI
jgi:hypothetical protein